MLAYVSWLAMPETRRPHRKTRTGCLECKRRRVKVCRRYRLERIDTTANRYNSNYLMPLAYPVPIGYPIFKQHLLMSFFFISFLVINAMFGSNQNHSATKRSPAATAAYATILPACTLLHELRMALLFRMCAPRLNRVQAHNRQ